MDKKLFKNGIKDGLPICIGYLAVSFSFGIFAVAGGLSILEAVLMSLTNLTSAGQLAAVPIIASGGLIVELALAQFVINLRYALMSLTLSQKFHKSVKLYDKLIIAFANTDEIFAVSASKPHLLKKSYMYGLMITPIIGWTSGTALGAILGSALSETLVLSLQLAIYGMFIAIVVPVVKSSKSTALCVLISAALSCAFYFIPALQSVPSGFVIIICAILASALMAYLAPINIPGEHEEVQNDSTT